MRFSEQWLREWVDPGLTNQALCEQLTMAGLEVETSEPVAAEFSGVVVGRVIAVEPHPNADKLRLCQVEVGGDEPLSIVCGAANVRNGFVTPTALIGAVLPNDFKIKRSKLRGVESNGMLCSAQELGLEEQSEGLLELPEDAPIGTDIREYLTLDDHVIELGLTPNRGDCLGLTGIAREVGTISRAAVTMPELPSVVVESERQIGVTIETPKACQRYVGRIIEGIDNTAETPLWMKERLRRGGLRPIGPVVDVTNYILLELGQPMHAFDLDALQGDIRVRMAEADERVRLLNGEEAQLAADILVIADQDQPLAVAGIMGGESSAVSGSTRDILLESACFYPEAIAGRARRLGLHTDSSHRFERGVDPQLQVVAIERASALLLSMVGGKAGPLVDSRAAGADEPRAVIQLRASRIKRLLGVEIDAEQVSDILRRLGMEVEEVEEGEAGWLITAPSFRYDIAIEEDLIEEVGRIYGYDRLPSQPPTGTMEMQPRSELQRGEVQLAQLLTTVGYQEAITYSFIDPKVQQLVDPDETPVPLANPISSDLSVMRTSLWPGLLQTLKHNVNRQQTRVRLFEIGMRFLQRGKETLQQPMIAGLAYGSRLPEQWGNGSLPIDFFDIKGDMERLLPAAEVEYRPARHLALHPALHPGRSAQVLLDQQPLGWIGALHPGLEKGLGVPSGCYLFELELARLLEVTVPKISELSRFPSIRRDIAIIVDDGISADEVERSIKSVAPETLHELKLFDVYTGEHIDSGRKSFALGLTLRAESRTLTDEEIDEVIQKVILGLGDDVGATLRE